MRSGTWALIGSGGDGVVDPAFGAITLGFQ